MKMTPKRHAALQTLAQDRVASLSRGVGDALVNAGLASRYFNPAFGHWVNGRDCGEKLYEITAAGKALAAQPQ